MPCRGRAAAACVYYARGVACRCVYREYAKIIDTCHYNAYYMLLVRWTGVNLLYFIAAELDATDESLAGND